jgi:hypothetical protein
MMPITPKNWQKLILENLKLRLNKDESLDLRKLMTKKLKLRADLIKGTREIREIMSNLGSVKQLEWVA